MNSNAWIRITERLAQHWKAWAEWNGGEREGPEPAITDFARQIFTRIVDWRFSFEAYKVAVLDSIQWRMGNVHGITAEELQQGYIVYPGEWEVVGVWSWSATDTASRLLSDFPWRPDEALLFMPDRCLNEDCTEKGAATEITDVSLLMGQPRREFPVSPS